MSLTDPVVIGFSPYVCLLICLAFLVVLFFFFIILDICSLQFVGEAGGYLFLITKSCFII